MEELFPKFAIGHPCIQCEGLEVSTNQRIRSATMLEKSREEFKLKNHFLVTAHSRVTVCLADPSIFLRSLFLSHDVY